MPALAIPCGMVVGLALGLTGAGGGIFAVPLLVYGLSLPPREAVGVSLASVGATALSGAVSRWRQGQVDVRTGVVLAMGGIVGAPVGTWLSTWMPESTLLLLFSVLMLIVAWRMWNAAVGPPSTATNDESASKQFACDRDAEGRLIWTPRCVAVLSGLGAATGILSGLFGVGGGFVIVPILVMLGGMQIHAAIATSLLVIFLVSISGVSSYVLGGGALSWQVTALFMLGGLAGMKLGSELSKKLSGPRLQRIFSLAVVAVAMLVAFRSWSST